MSTTIAKPSSRRQSTKMKISQQISTGDQIQTALGQVFQEAQRGLAGHRKHVVVLKAIQQRAFELGFEDQFNLSFCHLINKVLVIKKSQIVGDRIVKLCASFFGAINSKDTDENAMKDDDEEEEDTLTSRFCTYVVRHLIRGIEAKDKNIRYRVCQLLAVLINNLGEIDDELYQTLLYALNKRIHDKEPTVRVQAVLSISRFQEDDSTDGNNGISDATGRLITVIQNDNSAEVRRTALLNLQRSKQTLPYLLERCRDENSINRKLVFTKVIPQIGDFRYLSLDKREKLLGYGLRDREESVRNAATQMFSHSWIENVGNDLIELLERLDVMNSTIAPSAMSIFFANRPDTVSKVNFPSELWASLTTETAFLARTFYEHCVKKEMDETIDNNFPEASKLASYLKGYLNQKKEIEDNGEDTTELDFILEQLLTIAKEYDFSDEIGRRLFLQVLRDSLVSDNLSEKIIDLSLQIIRKLAINETDYSQLIVEVISDVKDAMTEEGDEVDEAFHLAISNNEVENENENENENDIKRKRKTLTPEDEGKKNILHHSIIIKCLTIMKSLLENLEDKISGNPPILMLLDTMVRPAVRSHDSEIREHGLRCLGLCSLLDQELATETLYLFGVCVTKGHESLRVEALKIISDILSIHGRKVLDVEGGVDSLSLYKLYYRALRNAEMPMAQSAAAEGLCKLYLADVMTDQDLFETLILTYFNPSSTDNFALVQALSFCIPVYSFSHISHQEKVGLVSIIFQIFTFVNILLTILGIL